MEVEPLKKSVSKGSSDGQPSQCEEQADCVANWLENFGKLFENIGEWFENVGKLLHEWIGRKMFKWKDKKHQ
jgi:hypothetical protein